MGMKILIVCLSLLSIFQMSFSTDNVIATRFVECMKSEICEVENGVERVLSCAAQMSEKDTQIYMDLAQEHLPGVKDWPAFIGKLCPDFDNVVKYVFDIMETMEGMEIDYTPEELQATVDYRACLFVMITDCELKKAFSWMGR